MDKKELAVLAVIIIIAASVVSIVFAPDASGESTSIEILNKKDIGENGTVYVKLKDSSNGPLSNKTIHIKLTDSNNHAVYEKTVHTHSTGVAIVKLENVSAGSYNINITFEGDANYTGCSVSQKLNIKGETVVDEAIENSTIIQETLADDDSTQDTQTTPTQSSSYTPSYSQSSSSSSSSRSSSSSSELPTYDENGRETLPEYDENGKEV